MNIHFDMEEASSSLRDAINWFNVIDEDEDRQLTVASDDYDESGECIFFNKEDGPLTVTYMLGNKTKTATLGEIPLTEGLVLEYSKRLSRPGFLILENWRETRTVAWSSL
jgi:hypothetical protein